MLIFALSFAACEPDDVVSDDGRSDSGDSGGGIDSSGIVYVSNGIRGIDELGARNIVVIHTDTLRRSHMPMFGYERQTMPQSSTHGWMKTSQHYAVASWTIPSTTSFLTALGSEHHHLTHFSPEEGPCCDVTAPTLPTMLHDAGFATYGAIGNVALLSVPYISADFDALGDETIEGGPAWMSQLVEGASSYLDTLSPDQRFFLFFQPMDTHAPYRVFANTGTWSDPEQVPFDMGNEVTEDEQVKQFADAYTGAQTVEEREAILYQLNAVYDEGMLRLDQGIAALYETLAKRGLLDDTLIILTSDHGETLNDDPYEVGFGHGSSERQELVHIPLMFSAPRIADQDVDCLSMNVDLIPTILQAMGAGPVDGIEGMPLQGACRDLAKSAVFVNNTDESKIYETMVTDGTYTLRRSCHRNATYYNDIASDPAGNIELPRSSIPTIDTLEAASDQYLLDLQEGTGAGDCAP